MANQKRNNKVTLSTKIAERVDRNRLKRAVLGKSLEDSLKIQPLLDLFKNFEKLDAAAQAIVLPRNLYNRNNHRGLISFFRNASLHNASGLISSLDIKSIDRYGLLASSIQNALLLARKNDSSFAESLLLNANLSSDLIYHQLKFYKDLENDNSIVKEHEIEYGKPDKPLISLNEAFKVQQIFKSIYADNEELYKVPPHDFEEMIAELLRHQGLKVELTKKTRDGGKDIIAIHDLKGLGFNRYLVECKRHAKDRPVGVGVVRELYCVLDQERANKGIIFTSSYFTKDAINLSQKYGSLFNFQDGVDILHWIKNYLGVS